MNFIHFVELNLKKTSKNPFGLIPRQQSVMVFVVVFLTLFLNLQKSFASDTSLKLQYVFSGTATDSVKDISGNGFNASLQNGAIVKSMGRFSVLDLGSANGYLDLTSKTGNLINTLSDFSISLYVYVDPLVNLSAAGNFIWTFANSDNMATTANGNMFFSALSNRFAISTTNWTGETSVSQNKALTKGNWQHITYTQSGTVGTIYVNGIVVKTGTININPANLGITTNNYLGKSCYTGDAYLQNTLLSDFRIYNRALSTNEITTLAASRNGLDSALFVQQVSNAKTQLTINGLNTVKSNLSLPTDGGNNIVITWISSNNSVISTSGVVTRPVSGLDTASVVLTATLSKNGITATKQFTAKVIPYYSDKISVQLDSTNLSVAGNLNLLRSNLTLPTSGMEGSNISWNSNEPTILSSAGVILNHPAKGSGNTQVTLTATITKGTIVTTKGFSVAVAEDEGFSGYLFVYFTGNNISQEAIRFALSNDGFIYNALNNNNPVLNSALISSSGGVRDPHILRGQNNDYYMVATDMVSANGWNSNRAMVLLKSTNLTDWTSTVINIPNTYLQYATADRVWAPQTIYDPSVGKYMVYWAMRLGSTDYDKIYYAYANSTFTGFVTTPKVLFDNNGLSTIDPDIIYKDGYYNLFFKTEGNGNGIKKALSTTLTGNYNLLDKYLQSTTNPVEGGCVFRMYNTDNWILMYDMYTSGAYQLTISTDLVNFSVVTNPVSFDFTPRHGTVMPVTAAEMQALKIKWGPTEVSPVFSDKLKLTAYPNPANTYLDIAVDSFMSGLKICVFDLKGEMIKEQNLDSSTLKMNIASFKPGIYILECHSTSKLLSSLKFVVK
jgi:hypothetical protein